MSSSASQATTTATPIPSYLQNERGDLSLSILMAIILTSMILAMVLVVAIFYFCKRTEQRWAAEENSGSSSSLAHGGEDRVATMHAAFMEAVDAERRRAGNDAWGCSASSYTRCSDSTTTREVTV